MEGMSSSLATQRVSLLIIAQKKNNIQVVQS